MDPQVGPILDANSNAVCVIDGRRIENAIWHTPASGHYVARVESFSLCGRPRTSWTVTVRRGGTVTEIVHGASFDTGSPTTGQALTVAEFDIAP